MGQVEELVEKFCSTLCVKNVLLAFAFSGGAFRVSPRNWGLAEIWRDLAENGGGVAETGDLCGKPKLSVTSTYTISITHQPCSHSYMQSVVKLQQFIN